MNVLRLSLCGLFLCSIFACNGSEPVDDDDDGDTSGGLFGDNNNNNNSSPECSDDGISPCIEEVEAWCYENTVGNSAFFWQINVEADDPQGDDTITEGTVTVTKDGETVHDAPIICNESDCFGSWNAGTTSPTMTCSDASAPQYTFKVIILDEDGNVSEAAATVGYLGYQ
jgi:hypothetical protein